MQLEDIENISVIGAGTMGHGIGLSFALSGYRVTMHDKDEYTLRKAVSRLQNDLETFSECGLVSRDRIIDTIANIATIISLEEASRCANFVIEAVSENVNVKKSIFNDLDEYCPEHTILASNTSSLMLRDFTAHCRRPDKILSCHWMNSPHILPAVEIAPTPSTSDATMDTIYTLLKRIGKWPVRLKKEIPGLLHARVQMGPIRKIWSVWQLGIANPEDIDLVIKGGFGLRLAIMGPLQMCDMGGLDIWLATAEQLFKEISNATEPPKKLKGLVKDGNLGVKTGQGFFNYYNEASDNKMKVKERDLMLINILKMEGAL